MHIFVSLEAVWKGIGMFREKDQNEDSDEAVWGAYEDDACAR